VVKRNELELFTIERVKLTLNELNFNLDLELDLDLELYLEVK
jgi:hypothetical protein